MPFAVFAGFNHGSIIDPTNEAFLTPTGPGTLALEALRTIRDDATYTALSERFAATSTANYAMMPADAKVCYQQFFFRVRDDVNQLVDDFYIDFHVVGPDGEPHEDLTLRFEDDFKTNFYTHSASKAYRVLMLDCTHLGAFGRALAEANARLVVQITGVAANRDVSYQTRTFVAYDPAAPSGANEPELLYPNTTTFIDVILDRHQTDRLLEVKNGALMSIPVNEAAGPAPTGRAALVAKEKGGA
jgi:hypothetical protein